MLPIQSIVDAEFVQNFREWYNWQLNMCFTFLFSISTQVSTSGGQIFEVGTEGMQVGEINLT
jgi:hypothetical protein